MKRRLNKRASLVPLCSVLSVQGIGIYTHYSPVTEAKPSEAGSIRRGGATKRYGVFAVLTEAAETK